LSHQPNRYRCLVEVLLIGQEIVINKETVRITTACYSDNGSSETMELVGDVATGKDSKWIGSGDSFVRWAIVKG
jgi:hypothetical protein